MRKYYRYLDEYCPVGTATRYVEALDGVAWREVWVGERCTLASNVLYPGKGLLLAEGSVSYDEISNVTQIKKAQFEAEWTKSLDANRGRWELAKAAYLIGQSVSATIVVFFPHGVILDLHDGGALGIANYNECLASGRAEWMYPGHVVTATVSNYDETYQWVILSSPTVHKEQRPFQERPFRF